MHVRRWVHVPVAWQEQDRSGWARLRGGRKSGWGHGQGETQASVDGLRTFTGSPDSALGIAISDCTQNIMINFFKTFKSYFTLAAQKTHVSVEIREMHLQDFKKRKVQKFPAELARQGRHSRLDYPTGHCSWPFNWCFFELIKQRLQKQQLKRGNPLESKKDSQGKRGKKPNSFGLSHPWNA